MSTDGFDTRDCEAVTTGRVSGFQGSSGSLARITEWEAAMRRSIASHQRGCLDNTWEQAADALTELVALARAGVEAAVRSENETKWFEDAMAGWRSATAALEAAEAERDGLKEALIVIRHGEPRDDFRTWARKMLRPLIETYMREVGFHPTAPDGTDDLGWGHRELGESRPFIECVEWQVAREADTFGAQRSEAAKALRWLRSFACTFSAEPSISPALAERFSQELTILGTTAVALERALLTCSEAGDETP